MTDITIVKRTQTIVINMDRRHDDKNRNGNSVIFVYTIYIFVYFLIETRRTSITNETNLAQCIN